MYCHHIEFTKWLKSIFHEFHYSAIVKQPCQVTSLLTAQFTANSLAEVRPIFCLLTVHCRIIDESWFIYSLCLLP